jgi:hypothetical protein
MLEDELAALWRKEIAHQRNPVFELEVMRRVERALYRQAIALNLALVAAATLFLAFLTPVLTAVWQQTFAHFVSAPVAALLLTALSILFSMMSGGAPRARFKARRAD